MKNKKRTIYLHIGYHKTGTTAIQNTLFDARYKLLKHGYYYPLSTLSSSGHHNIGAELLGMRAFSEDFGTLKDLVSEIGKVSADNFIISSERLDKLDSPHIEKLAEYFQEYKVIIIVYLRRQDQLLQSVWSQVVKNGRPLISFEKWLRKNYINADQSKKRLDRLPINYEQALEKWSTVFGQENIRVQVYERSSFGSNIVENFLNLCDMDDISWLPDSSITNVSPGFITLEIIRQTALIIRRQTTTKRPPDHLDNTYARIYALLRNELEKFEHTGSKLNLVDKSIYDEIMSKYGASNQAIARNYLGRDRLFLENFVDKPLTTSAVLDEVNIIDITQVMGNVLCLAIQMASTTSRSIKLIEKLSIHSTMKVATHVLGRFQPSQPPAPSSYDINLSKKNIYIYLSYHEGHKLCVQQSLCLNRETLNGKNFHYIETDHNTTLDDFCSKLYAELKNSPSKNFIVVNPILNHFSKIDIQKFLTEFDAFNITVVAHVYPQQIALQSIWVQQVVTGKQHLAFGEWVNLLEASKTNSPQNLQLDYDLQLGMWADILGDDQIIVKPIEVMQLGEDIFVELLQDCGLQDISEIYFEDPIKFLPSLNTMSVLRTITATISQKFRTNSQHFNNLSYEVFSKLYETAYEKDWNDGKVINLIDDEFHKKIMLKYQESNSRLASRFLERDTLFIETHQEIPSYSFDEQALSVSVNDIVVLIAPTLAFLLDNNIQLKQQRNTLVKQNRVLNSFAVMRSIFANNAYLKWVAKKIRTP